MLHLLPLHAEQTARRVRLTDKAFACGSGGRAFSSD
jgi:hypothetical protein